MKYAFLAEDSRWINAKHFSLKDSLALVAFILDTSYSERLSIHVIFWSSQSLVCLHTVMFFPTEE